MSKPSQASDDKSDATFVSRRGRKVGMHELDMTGIDIEKDESIQPRPAKVKPAKAVVTAPRSSSRTFSRRKFVVFAVLLALIGTPLLGAELLAVQYRAGVRGAHERLSGYVKSTVLPAQEKNQIKADEVRGIAQEVDGIANSMCRGGLLDNVAMLYPRASDALDSCKTAQSEVSSLVSQLFTMESQLRTIERINVCLGPAVAPVSDGYAVLGAQRELWQQASECVGDVSPSRELRKAHTQLESHVDAVASAWQQLDMSNASQDSAGFVAAEKTLASEYEAVRATAADVSEVVRSGQRGVTAAYSKKAK